MRKKKKRQKERKSQNSYPDMTISKEEKGRETKKEWNRKREKDRDPT